MKIKTKLQIGIGLISLLAIAVVAYTIVMTMAVSSANRKRDTADSISSEILDLTLLTRDYNISRSEADRVKWEGEYRRLGLSLAAAEKEPHSSPEITNIRAIRDAYARTGTIFDRLVALYAGERPGQQTAAARTSEDALMIELADASRPMASAAAALSASGNRVLLRTNEQQGIVTSILVALIALAAAGGTIWVGRSIWKPLTDLQQGISEVAAGDLDRRVEVTSSDEVGLLADSFNRMTERIEASDSELREEIAERAAVEENLREATGYLESLINYANAPIIVWDSTFRITRFNSAFARLTGFSVDEVIGRELGMLFPEESRDESLGRIVRTLSGEHFESVEIPVLTTEGGVRIALWNSANIYGNYGKTVVATIAQGQDITERKRLEEELRLTIADLARSNEELEQFAYVASHDLQEPLRMVGSYVQLIEKKYKGRLDKDADEFMEYAVDGAKRMQELINDLLAYSRVGRRGTEFSRVGMNRVLETVERNLRVSIEQKNATITADELPVVAGDEVQLVQLLQNLISNSIKFRSEADPRVRVSASRQDDEWLFAVEDNGIGFEQRYAKRIFNIFQRLQGRGEYEGTGIGLAISSRIVQRHGGAIWARSEPGGGSVFYFTIPVERGKA